VKRKSNIKRVAEAAGVSAMTISRYFNQPQKLSSATLGRVEAAIKTLKYVPNNAARTLLRGNSETLAFIGHVAHHFDYTILRGIEDFVYESKYLLFLCNTDSARRKEGHFIAGLMRHCVDGVIINPRYNRDNLLFLAEHHVPTVVVDPKTPDTPFDVVRSHAYEAGYLLTKTLLEEGFKRIAFIGGPQGVTSLEERLGGYTTAMREAGHTPTTQLGEYSRDSGFEITRQLFSSRHQKIDTLIAANGLVARGVLAALKTLGLNHHADVAVAAFDATEEYFDLETPLTANMVQPAYDLGRYATQMLIERIQGFDGPPREKVLPFRLVTHF
jgi:DNA-binding LacI/PurR family transcriptional regulator